ncbi:amino acid ABC transporter permease [Psychrobacillus sp. NPDC093180]|uniref:amino acid ABC transporter permease n=1 Tax=Psychrobacillus sp. NPDC093180 TaxID=3364489 RepID=UPI0037FE90B9
MDLTILTNYYDLYLLGIKNTLIASLISIMGAMFLGTFIAVCRIYPNKLLNGIAAAYVEFIRNIPLLVVIFFFFIGLSLNGFISGVLGLIIYYSTLICEAIRAGILSIPKGQLESALSTGLNYSQAMRNVILPQAIRVVIPPIGNQFLNIVKNSSLIAVVAGFDLMYYSDIIASKTYKIFDVYIFAGVFYLLLTIPISIGVQLLEKKLSLNN